MSETAPSYLIVGRGRVARHVAHYFSLRGLFYDLWHREEGEGALEEKAKIASHILLLVSDGAIEEVARKAASFAPEAKRIHFSGALVTKEAYGAHPLMTFGEALYEKEKYAAIPFVIEKDAPPFAELLPGLSNRHARLDKEKKALYHALCVLAGNFSCLLWQRFFDGLEEDLSLPPEIGTAYLKQQTENILHDYKSALTGPLVRGDEQTLAKNIEALGEDPFADVYKIFVHAYRVKKEGPSS